MAFSCALLIEPIAGAGPVAEVAAAPKKARHRQRPKLSPVPALSRAVSAGSATADIPDRKPEKGERWGSDMPWPEEWRKGPSAKPPS
jgi:hypothetical protein